MVKLFKKGSAKSPEGESLKGRFSKIFDANIFGGVDSRSGGGSDMEQTALIRRVLPDLVKELGIQTFVDAPCGDWHWMKSIDLGVEKYIGIDIVDSIIENNKREFGNSTTRFISLNLAEDPLPRADMIFCRDCLVHLTFADIHNVIANFKKSGTKYLLTTTFAEREYNLDLADAGGMWRTLNLELPPFNFPSPKQLINEQCTEVNGQFNDKSLGLWCLNDL
ncbi:class I SAM-dependent methyltransferase [Mariprofundus ferrooxydans]|uniref:class I SAM-dependent methyltransferase n=1 Tax=Mariprofundus ferrooxydans TaxID=314344 RepID=UPI001431494E|nr:class I SAM-dependent methyltransferase [Mariprofundus ferrooxydans]